MRAYNVEFFDRDFNYITNQMVPDFTYTYDYLSKSSNVIVLQNDSAIFLGCYIRVTGAAKEIVGIVTAIDTGSGSKNLMNVTFEPLTSFLDVDILFDTDLQGSSVSLEQCLANLITDMYITNTDTLQNIRGLSVQVTSTTNDWGFNLKSTNEGMHTLIINFWDSIIAKALTKYQVVVDFSVDFFAQTIECTIGRNPAYIKVIEADLPNIVQKNVVVDSSNESANKVIIYNGNDYTQHETYYLHPDKSFDTTDADRITPVACLIREVVLESEESSFSQAAASEASSVFGSSQYNNLIEIETLVDDEMVEAGSIGIGQVVNILSNGQEYRSILSGFTMGNTITLTFGVIRLDLTQKLRRT